MCCVSKEVSTVGGAELAVGSDSPAYALVTTGANTKKTRKKGDSWFWSDSVCTAARDKLLVEVKGTEAALAGRTTNMNIQWNNVNSATVNCGNSHYRSCRDKAVSYKLFNNKTGKQDAQQRVPIYQPGDYQKLQIIDRDFGSVLRGSSVDGVRQDARFSFDESQYFPGTRAFVTEYSGPGGDLLQALFFVQGSLLRRF